MKRFTATAVAAALFLALAAYVYFMERGPSRKERADEAKKPVVAEIDAAKAVSLEIVFGGETLRIEKKKGSWRLASPVDARTNKLAVETLLEALREIKSEGVAGKMEDAAEFGLDSPRLEAAITLDSGQTVKIVVGDAAPVGGNFYAARSGGDSVYLVSSYTIKSLEVTADGLRDKSLTEPLERDKIRRVTAALGAASVTCERGKPGDGEKEQAVANLDWRISGATEKECANEALDLMSALEFNEAAGFAEPSDADSCGLESPAYSLEFGYSNGEKKTFTIGAPGGDRYCLKNPDRNEIYIIDKRLIESMEALRMLSAKL
ncbi:MAG TPA: DUF4340 domain-containing protein [bacterium]|nr:MAG: hypothetical protein BWY28_03013 [bacterium ADurb.Bin236]HOY63835.1 DUF4340 domain-containing protein [bacterium]HPI77046.1 DUF4340 domain-containing protein [bacterium]HPN94897.1 DUF4340 domain-containing protein [bacterium]